MRIPEALDLYSGAEWLQQRTLELYDEARALDGEDAEEVTWR